MMNIYRKVSGFLNNQNQYFKEFSNEIALRNLQLMKTVCYAGIAIFILYFSLTKIFFSSWSISALNLLPVPIFIIFIFLINKQLNEKELNTKKADMITFSIYVFLLCVAIILSVFPYPDVTSIYYHLIIVAYPVLFILPFYIHIVILPLSYIIFSVLVVCFKSPELVTHELFESFTALIFTFIVMVIMSQFRLQSDSLKSKYYQMSRLDGLTHLINKSSGTNTLKQYISQAKHDEHLAVLFIDLDNFKNINDTYGHLMGDKLLRAVADSLITHSRELDTVCRFGGDEFLLVFKDISDKSAVVEKVEEIQNLIKAISINPINEVTCSIGVCYIESVNDMTAEEIINNADKALYQAKQQGKNGYCFS